MIDVGGAQLWCWDTGGDGEPVVLLHAVVGSGAFWGYQQPVFADAGYRVVGYSRRGHFRSETGPRETTGTAAGDLAELLTALGIEAAHIVGTAAGGFVATDFAISRPKRVRSLTISTSLATVLDHDYMAALATMRTPEFRAIPAHMRELGPGYRSVNPEGAAAWMQRHDEAVAEKVEQGFLGPLTLEAFGTLSMPVLLIAADADMYAPPPVVKKLADRLAHARLELIAGAGHSAFWEQPGRWNRIVLDFLDRNRA
jgi:pimeloyl-ACP methyl ester carboxylesterase